MELHGPHPHLRRHARQLKNLPGENETGSRRSLQRRGVRGRGETPVRGVVHAQGGCAQGAEIDGQGERGE